jgi:hypothetical protein
MKMKTQLPEPIGHSKGSPKNKFIAMSAYIEKTEISQINDIMLHFKLLEKQEQAKPKQAGEK